ncbi:MAG: carbohydrate kinase, partial [Loktanella sp.]|nr:carbohydrate kinase [Loktanella sp.]
LDARGLLTKAKIGSATMEELTQAAAFGAKVAAITVSRAGANPPWASEL